jgi:predicted dehydrogenase
MKKLAFVLLIYLSGAQAMGQETTAPLKLGVVGLVHSHVHWILNRASDGDFEIVGIAEPNLELAKRFLAQYNLPMSLVYPSIEEMLESAKPEAVTAFNTIRDHLKVVELCAPKGIHVMVEKPLAVNLDHARKMAKLARDHNIHLLTNYETTWYASHHRAYEILQNEPQTFEIRKIVVHDGHRGPMEIGVDPEFLEWLTDPYWNGAGALTDFGCYGANLSTWFHHGIAPEAVFAVTQQIKPDIYPKVDDEATIVLTYPKSQTIIQASWNWNYSRKDIEIYGKSGYVHCLNARDLRIMHPDQKDATSETASDLRPLENDPFRYLIAVINGDIVLKPTDLSSLENNLTVMTILQASMISAKEGRKVNLSELD